MLLFIIYCYPKIICNLLFKYISCYCLSIFPIRAESRAGNIQRSFRYCLSIFPIRGPVFQNNSNTSHVIVYLYRPVGVLHVCQFKYISCYCLSFRPVPGRVCTSIQIHLMLLFILDGKTCPICRGYSNTSHVIVYPGSQPGWEVCSCIQIHLMLLFISPQPHRSLKNTSIQIHLMLLFIPSVRNQAAAKGQFKYISCYCLSSTNSISILSNSIQIHLMLLFIFAIVEYEDGTIQFKYISCYCLSVQSLCLQFR